LLADLYKDGRRIACATEFRQRELISSVPGARWSREDGMWLVPLSWSACIALRTTFGDDLVIGDSLREWAEDYRERILVPAAEFRDAFSADGDPDLFPHQRADVQYLAGVRRAILASSMGTGKSASTIRTMVELTRRGEDVFPALVVCPNSVKYNWQREFSAWWPGVVSTVVHGTAVQRRKQFLKPSNVYIINYESLRSHSRLAPYGSIALRRCVACGGEDPKVTPARCEVHVRELNEIGFRTVVADEVHRVKDPKSKQSRALKAAASGAEFRYALTGTPIANSVMDLWSILNFIDPDEWPSRVRWTERLLDIVYNVFGGVVVSGVKADRQHEFDATVAPRMRRMTKEVVLPFLPPIMEERRDVEMTPKQQKAYDQLLTSFIAELEGSEPLVAVGAMTKMLRLLQIASSYGEVEVSIVEDVDDFGAIVQREVQKLVLTAPSNKVDAFLDDLADFEGRQVIVFAVSKQLIMLLAAALEKKGASYGLIVGGQSMLDRQIAIDDFQDGKTQFVLATVGAGGTGITLTAADTVVYLQRSWSLIEMDQSLARCHRIGSERHESITRIDYVTPGTVEEVVIGALDGKFEGLENLVKDRELLKRALTEGGSGGS
jgi:SNF2 family DNA or RNA helicase